MSPHLDFLMRAVLGRLEVISTVAASKPDKKGKGSKPEAQPPPWGEAPADWLRRKYERCQSDDDRRNVITEALDTLRSLRFSRAAPGAIDLTTKEGKERIAKDPRPVRLIAHAYGYTEGHIYHIKRQAKKNG